MSTARVQAPPTRAHGTHPDPDGANAATSRGDGGQDEPPASSPAGVALTRVFQIAGHRASPSDLLTYRLPISAHLEMPSNLLPNPRQVRWIEEMNGDLEHEVANPQPTSVPQPTPPNPPPNPPPPTPNPPPTPTHPPTHLPPQPTPQPPQAGSADLGPARRVGGGGAPPELPPPIVLSFPPHWGGKAGMGGGPGSPSLAPLPGGPRAGGWGVGTGGPKRPKKTEKPGTTKESENAKARPWLRSRRRAHCQEGGG